MKKLLAPLCLGLLTSLPVAACTGIVLKSADGATIPARTMEFGFDIQSNIVMVPAGTKITSLSNNPDKEGLTYKTKYGFGGANALGKNIVLDGLNEKGLYFGAFYFAGLAQYTELTDANPKNAVSSEELGNYILGNFSTVDEMIKGIKSINVVGTHIAEIGRIAPLHYAITDASGKSVVLEYTAKGLTIHENKIGVVTNNPTYDWHMTNLHNYVGLTAENKGSVTINGVTLSPTGQGSGMLGLPGDYTPPSRFIRAASFVNASLPSKNSDEAVFRAFHILNAFDIPKGVIREKANNEVLTDYTIWTSVVDTKNKDYYFKSYLTPQHMKVNIIDALANLKAPKVIKMEGEHTYKDLTGQFNQ
ncbi:choloylglycine hydrolase family protein [uncultured Photobacterium sp.]|uniref:choloylglycine hydrolase family protein n=1 Tax=uncultured Photobacterium sp. TaxID=173973 RepID=UPI0026048366|nr:choloylglycine hydrolase family protein [uncultured Photobacterium sp.]